METAELLEYARILRLRPDDVVVIEVQHSTEPWLDRINDLKRKCFPHNEVIVLSEGATLRVARPDDTSLHP